MREIQQKADAYLLELNLVSEQNIEKVNNMICNLRTTLNRNVLRLTMGDLFNKKTTTTGHHDLTSTNCTGADMTSVSNQTMAGCYTTQMSGMSGKNRSDEGKEFCFGIFIYRFFGFYYHF